MRRKVGNKKLLIIGIVIACVVVILLLVLFILSDSSSKVAIGNIIGNIGGKCGDGICQEVENEKMCPADCEQQLPESAEPVDDAVETTLGDVTTFDIPNAPCSEIRSAPVVVNDFILWMNHDKTKGCAGQTSEYKHYIMLYNPDSDDEKLYAVGPFTQSEGTISYIPEKEIILFTTLGTTKLFILDAKTFEEIASVDSEIRANVDTSQLYVPNIERIFVGTINSPSHCTGNSYCGDVFAIDMNGNVVDRINKDSTVIINSWISGAPITDGKTEYIFVGGSEGADGPWAYDCSVIKLDFDLNIIAYHDPGIIGCQNLEGAEIEDAVAGEVVFGAPVGADNTLWVQFTAPTAADNKVQLIHYDSDLNELCKAEWYSYASNKWLSAKGYQAPTVDHDGNAWVTWTLQKEEEEPSVGYLYKVTPTCEVTEITAGLPDSRVTPTLAEDYVGNHYVLVAAKGEFYIYKSSGELYKKYDLGSNVAFSAAPLVFEGVIYAVDNEGTLYVIKNSGLSGLNKDAYWPTFRHDQYRTGNLLTPLQ